MEEVAGHGNMMKESVQPRTGRGMGNKTEASPPKGEVRKEDGVEKEVE